MKTPGDAAGGSGGAGGGSGGAGGGGKPHPDGLRAGNEDRELVADRLRAALDEGRITLSEFDERVAGAYQALTYADLNTLLADIPTSGGVLEIRPMREFERPKTSKPKDRPVEKRRDPHRMPTPLMILWTIYGAIVGINIAVWLLVCITTTSFIYPWPVWVAGPLGAMLLAATIGVQAIRNREHRDDLS